MFPSLTQIPRCSTPRPLRSISLKKVNPSSSYLKPRICSPCLCTPANALGTLPHPPVLLEYSAWKLMGTLEQEVVSHFLPLLPQPSST